ncbi:hypothetical protein CYB_1753 [Synechococcus sp. JA-2-3B'a(2-13)]|nr:hypothetical protein CYB_1753 [Synechococcus sp. JA-2-3B'a(2-13)]
MPVPWDPAVAVKKLLAHYALWQGSWLASMSVSSAILKGISPAGERPGV